METIIELAKDNGIFAQYAAQRMAGIPAKQAWESANRIGWKLGNTYSRDAICGWMTQFWRDTLR